MPNAITRHLAVLRAHMAAPFALSQLRRRYVRAEEIRAALDGIKHDDSKRAHEPAQPPVGTYGLGNPLLSEAAGNVSESGGKQP